MKLGTCGGYIHDISDRACSCCPNLLSSALVWQIVMLNRGKKSKEVKSSR